jgi:hypothetical protein
MFTWTPATRVKLHKLRHEKNLTLKRCASIIGCSESAVYKALYPKPPKPKPVPIQKPKPKVLTLLPPRILHSSCPTRRKIDLAKRDARPPTKNEMYATLAQAVRNTI